MRGVRASSLRGKNRDNLPADQRREEGVLYNECSEAKYTNRQWSLCTWPGLPLQTETSVLKLGGGLGVLSTVQDGNLLSPRRAFKVEGAVVGSGGEQDTTLRMHGVKIKYGEL